MTTVLFCINSFRLGGVERRLSLLIRGLSTLNRYKLVCIVNNCASFLMEEVKYLSEIIEIEKNSDINRTVCKYESTILEIKPVIVHCWTMTQCDIINRIHPEIKKTFYYICGAINSAFEYPTASRHYQIIKECIVNCTCFVSNSIACAQAKHLPKDKTIIIKNGYDFETKHPYPKNMSNQEIDQVIDPIRRMVLMACRISHEKDIIMFFELAHKMSQITSEIVFVLVGNGELCNDVFFHKLSDSPNIIFLGYRTDVYDLIKHAHVCVLFSNPPHKEGLSNFIIEAMANKKPVIATTGGGTNELVSHNETGFLVKPHDCDSVITILLNLLNDETLYNKIAENACLYIKKNLNLKTMISQYDNLYRSLIKDYNVYDH